MEYEQFEHEADVGIRGFGKTVEEAFENGAKAMFQVMAEIKNVEAKEKKEVHAEAEDIEGLFIEWLNSLLSLKDIESMFFSKFKVFIKENKKYSLTGEVWGEKIDTEKHKAKTEVKGATYSMLKVGKNKRYYAQCIVDV